MNKKVENATVAKQILLEHLREYGNEWFPFNASNFAKDMGVHPTTVQRHIHLLISDGLIEVRHPHGKRGGYEIRCLNDGERHTEDSERHVKVQVTAPVRVCRYCKTEAANEKARFCWKCGKTLLTEKELLKEEFNMTLGRICRFINDSAECNRIMETLDKVGKIAFTEEQA